ncbi:phosphate acyltransferase PlsX [Tuberibacillus sp. Marseille-P3662]|uniref:phosphate acyltransferase PlsX n=1 Tax=Tuberibacillus sp. Marseille-P3662 TaxID=1965358 RepID=UPI000A1C96DA|nr:phosphate acyltransferase PlsX [Tuberibacillus sp. Marseille-P3662]
MKLAIDAMGGDNAPQAIVEGTLKALQLNKNLEVTLVGDEQQIKPLLQQSQSTERLHLIHTNEVITPNDAPVKSVRKKKDASMVLAVNEVKEGRADAVISAGNTGALMSAGLFGVGRVNGIDRPALAPTLPVMKGSEGFLFLDVGSNMDARPEHLLQYAIMGSIYTQKVGGKQQPTVGLLNVGEEQGKGNQLCKEAFALLEKAPIHFVGNVESRDLLNGAADVVVADGFSGNLVLKSIEGTALSVFSLVKQQLTGSLFSKLIASLLYPKLKGIKNKMDYSNYGGACLFGLAAPVIKAHGSSNADAVYRSIQQADLIVSENVIGTIEQAVLDTKEQWQE